MSKGRTYISLFSNAGIGCYGFKQAGFDCIATNEILEERIKIQRFNRKCKYESGYICGDITLEPTKDQIYKEIEFWKKKENLKEVDVVIATPPCQGISVANHKKKDEIFRNSLILESISITDKISPKFFVFENVRGFLNAQCQNLDGTINNIKYAIESRLGNYNIIYKVINFADYGSPSNRTRTLVLGVRKDLKDISPYDILPDSEKAMTLKESIGQLPSLKKMGEIDVNDIFHNFRPYPERMTSWIKHLKEGQSAFEQDDIEKKPHQIKNGKIVLNKNKNGDKYSRCFWNRPGFCIHTRNDQLASQKTIHPKDNRVFSIREVMHLMSVPDSFKWSEQSLEELNCLSNEEKLKFLKKNELNIRRTLGEAVPTIIFRKIADKIVELLDTSVLSDKSVKELIETHKLYISENLQDFFLNNINLYSFKQASKIAEQANAERLHNAAYYTSQETCFTIINDLPEFENKDSVNILEPSVGTGNFLPLLIGKYRSKKTVNIDVIDIDSNAIKILKLLLKKIEIPSNFNLNYINEDFLCEKACFGKEYDVVIGNPPFKKITKKPELLNGYKTNIYNTETNNLFSFFIEKALKISDYVAFVLPKTLLSAPEYNKTREILNRSCIEKICDYGEKAFNIKIETISIIINNKKKNNIELNPVKIESYILNKTFYLRQGYLADKEFPYWLIYRDSYFDEIAQKMKFDIFKSYRDRHITNKILLTSGKYRVLKSRNIGNNKIINMAGYDCYINSLDNLNVAKFINNEKIVLIPNLTYNPRACFLPEHTICDGSVALAEPKNGYKITKKDLAFYATDEFKEFYKIARNISSRSMNIDSNSIFFFGLPKRG